MVVCFWPPLFFLLAASISHYVLKVDTNCFTEFGPCYKFVPRSLCGSSVETLHELLLSKPRTAMFVSTSVTRDLRCKALILMLLLRGTVEVNPGPIRFPCGYCSKPVKINQLALCCDGCDIWYHIPCLELPLEV